MRPPPRSLLPAIVSPVWVLAAVVLYAAALSVWVFSPAFPMHWLRELQLASDGWINATLILAALLGLGQLGLLFGPGRQRPATLGWHLPAIRTGLLATLALWLAMNASTLVASRIGGTPLAWHPGWAEGGLLPGALAAQLLGTALLEETVFRAWLWPQFASRLATRLPCRVAWVLALVASQALFALAHIPARIAGGAGPTELGMAIAGLFVVGAVLALLYAATRNLFFVVGVHALGNAPTLLAEPQGPSPTLVMLVAALVVAGAWAYRHWRQEASRETARPAHRVEFQPLESSSTTGPLPAAVQPGDERCG
ncbi:CPBP family intramembrane glutamic endopeptidase [Luteimonas sp. SDU82]|uniref:CPBP family intramembrane glutamic endopeptidase n=1 Tax=Luteimonas sp. SDU82 TaxID=3422592 RepID=UPI003EB7EFB2